MILCKTVINSKLNLDEALRPNPIDTVITIQPPRKHIFLWRKKHTALKCNHKKF